MLNTRHWDRHKTGGLNFTELGFGTAPLGNLYKAIPDTEARATLDQAWESGMRYFDTAPLYGLGLSETRLNAFLRDKPRDQYLLSSKVGRIMKPCAPEAHTGRGKWFDVPQRQEQYDYSYDGVMRSVEFSLERLGVSRIDILYVHDLCISTHGSKQASDAWIDSFFYEKGYAAMLELRDQGIIKAIEGGVNEWEVCQILAERYALLEQEALESFLPLCEARGIGIVGGLYNSGILATGAVPGVYYNYDPAPAHIMEKVTKIEAICAQFNVPPIAAALQFLLLHRTHVAVIPGGQSAEQTRSNIAALECDIPSELWTSLKSAELMYPDAPTGLSR